MGERGRWTWKKGQNRTGWYLMGEDGKEWYGVAPIGRQRQERRTKYGLRQSFGGDNRSWILSDQKMMLWLLFEEQAREGLSPNPIFVMT